MSEWIKSSERLPEQREHCWIYGFRGTSRDKFVFDGYFDKASTDLIGGKLIQGPGWEYDTEMSDYIMGDQISHWMPYFTPNPPEES